MAKKKKYPERIKTTRPVLVVMPSGHREHVRRGYELEVKEDGLYLDMSGNSVRQDCYEEHFAQASYERLPWPPPEAADNDEGSTGAEEIEDGERRT